MNRAIFLDRDGTIIKEKGFICDFKEVEFFPFSVEATRLMNENGYKVIVVTNQSAIARGICSEQQVQNIHNNIKKYFKTRGAVIDGFYYCPFHLEAVLAAYRKKDELCKPAPGMLFRAAKDFKINLRESFMIGDDVRDIIAGEKAGCRTILVKTGKGVISIEKFEGESINPDYICNDIMEAAKLIIDL